MVCGPCQLLLLWSECHWVKEGCLSWQVEQLHKIFKLCGSPSEEYWKKSKLPHATIFKPQQPYKRSIRDHFKEFPTSSLALLDTLLAIEPADRGSASEALNSDVSVFFCLKQHHGFRFHLRCLLRVWCMPKYLWVCLGTNVLGGRIGSFSRQSHLHVTHQAYLTILLVRSLMPRSGMMKLAGIINLNK